MKVLVACSACSGTGETNTPDGVCPVCEGTGQVWQVKEDLQIWELQYNGAPYFVLALNASAFHKCYMHLKTEGKVARKRILSHLVLPEHCYSDVLRAHIDYVRQHGFIELKSL
jgi:hypothetical protein